MYRSPDDMVKGMRRRFILIASGVVALLMALVLATLNAASYLQTMSEQQAVLSAISDAGGTLPEFDKDKSGLGFLTPEGLNQVRFFSVTFTGDTAATVNVEHISVVDEDEAATIADALRRCGNETGIYTHDEYTYLYKCTSASVSSSEGSASASSGTTLVTVLDITGEMSSVRRMAALSAAFGFGFLVFFVLLVTLISGRAMEPIARNLRSQREFVTNASHELKTPVAIIQANTELIEMTRGTDDQTEAIKRQTKRLTDLINRLVALSRLQETGQDKLAAVDFSQTVGEVAEGFKVVVEGEGKAFSAQVEPDLEVKAEPRALRELANILLDNANKYCDAGGAVSVRLEKTTLPGSRARLTVSNSYAAGESQDFSRYFERFYREDDSHNSGKSGSGIGLSMAEQIVSNFHGKIRVAWAAGTISFVVTL